MTGMFFTFSSVVLFRPVLPVSVTDSRLSGIDLKKSSFF